MRYNSIFSQYFNSILNIVLKKTGKISDGLIILSNYGKKDCLYCGIRRTNTNADTTINSMVV